MYIVRSGHRVNSYVHNAKFQDLKIHQTLWGWSHQTLWGWSHQTLWGWSHQRGWTMSKISTECIKL